MTSNKTLGADAAAVAAAGSIERDAASHADIHSWFELSYAQYLTVPRSVLQSMPLEWQHRFVRCLEELDEAIDWRPANAWYRVELRELRDHYTRDGYERKWGRLVTDPLRDYERGRRRIPLRPEFANGNPASQATASGSVPSEAP